MNRLPKLALATVLAAALAVPALAQAPAPAQPPAAPAAEAAPAGGPGFWSRKHGEREAWGQRGQRGERMRGHHGFSRSKGMMGMMGMMGAAFDTDGDGVVTRAEMKDGLAALVTKHDADGNGTLSLDEFEGLYAEVMRPMTVRAFQWIDADGDGQLSEAEQARAQDMLSKRLPGEAPAKPAQ